jgi:CMP-N-acetylneuraminic acid synthetase
MNKFLAIIPARGGSKRLPNKNILKLNNKPLIAWSIEAAKDSKYIDTVVVSSDSNKILNIAKQLNVDTLKRPDYLASDTATTIDTVKHTIKFYPDYEYIVLLQPTSPLRNAKHIDEAIELLISKNADAIISVCESEHSPLWMNTLDKTLSMKNFLNKELINKRSQDLKKYYRLNGAIYICKTKKLLEQNTFFLNDKIYAYIMDKKSSVDIDDEFDFLIAKAIFNESFYS